MNGSTSLRNQAPIWSTVLPTDHEWSLAAGIGIQENSSQDPRTKSGRLETGYLWGNYFPPRIGDGNFCGSEIRRLAKDRSCIEGYRDNYPFAAPVGLFRSSESGLFDLAGNVWEMCFDKMDDYATQIVYRGACHDNFQYNRFRHSYRTGVGRGANGKHLGCRLVIGTPAKSPSGVSSPANGVQRIEATTLLESDRLVGGKVRVQEMKGFGRDGSAWSEKKQVYWTQGKPGDRLILVVKPQSTGKKEVTLFPTASYDYGKFHISVGETTRDVDLFSKSVRPAEPIGFIVEVEDTENHVEIEIEIAGTNLHGSQGYVFGLDRIEIVPAK